MPRTCGICVAYVAHAWHIERGTLLARHWHAISTPWRAFGICGMCAAYAACAPHMWHVQSIFHQINKCKLFLFFVLPKTSVFFWEIFQILYLNYGCGVLQKKGVKSETNFISIIPNISIKQQARCYASCWER